MSTKMSPCYSDMEDIDGEFERNNNTLFRKKKQGQNFTVGKKGNDLLGTVVSTGLAISCVLYSLFTTTLLVWFLSGNANGILKQRFRWSDLSAMEAMIQDVCLILLFVTQHKVMAKNGFKKFISALMPRQLQRSFYILSTGFVIQCMSSYWINAVNDSTLVLWDISNSSTVCLLCQWLHFISWIYTFFIVLTMDFTEFIGLKQVYYHANGFGCPMSAKKPAARRFFNHFRHPTYIGLVVVFWFVPCMTMDRLLLSCAFTVYLFSTEFDHEDAQYVQEMYEKKLKALSD